MAECATPFTVKTNDQRQVAVPCGKCPACYARRISGWSFRLLQEDKVSSTSYFITLTYSDGNARRTKNGFLTIDKTHVQKFFKRLRRNHPAGTSIRYYTCGEYGSTTYRPHYHAIIFNARLECLISKKEAWAVKEGLLDLDGKTQFQCPTWGHGHITIGKVQAASVGYCLKYMAKAGKIPQHKNDDRQREFSLMSKGLGKSYLTPAMEKWHHDDLLNRMYCNLQDGKKITMPRYYKQKLYTDEQRESIGDVAGHKVDTQLKKDLADNPNHFYDKMVHDKHQFVKLKHDEQLRSKV